MIYFIIHHRFIIAVKLNLCDSTQRHVHRVENISSSTSSINLNVSIRGTRVMTHAFRATLRKCIEPRLSVRDGHIVSWYQDREGVGDESQ